MDSKVLGNNIRKYRNGKGLTQEAVAEMTGLSVNYYRQIELGNKTPQLKTFISIAEALDAPTDSLLDGILNIEGLDHADDLITTIHDLPASKRNLVMKQLETLLESLEDL